MNGLGV